jgi:nitroimidazol reductase NimA-like FMN-containing flavoprotein (pyridoxamine 5'-phosphate oxidase superfamily)
MSKEMSPTLKAFCEEQELLRFAYLDAKGYPRVLPVWFVVIDGEYYFGTGATSAKWKAIQRNAKTGWVIDGGPMNAYKGASMCGTAEEVTDAQLRARIYEALGKKYFNSVDHPKFIEIYGGLDDTETVYLKLKAEDGLSWEY